MLRPIRIAFALGVLLSSSSAAAMPSCEAPGAVRVEISVAGASPQFEEAVVADLRAGLSRRDIALCPMESGHSVASIRIEMRDANSSGVEIGIVDAVTAKRVSRELTLTTIPQDSRSLAVAVAAEELLRATWAELALDRAPPPAAAPPRQVQNAAEPRVTKPTPKASYAYELAFVGATERYTGGQTHIGGDITLLRDIVRPVSIELGMSARRGIASDAALGQVDTFAGGGGVAGVVAIVDTDDFGLGIDAGMRFLYASFEGEARSGAISKIHDGLAIIGRGGLRGALHLTSALRLRLRVGVGAPVRSVIAQSDGADLTGINGVELGANVGFGVRF